MLARLSHTKTDERPNDENQAKDDKCKADKHRDDKRKDDKHKDDKHKADKPKDDKHGAVARKARPKSSKSPAPVVPTPVRLLLRMHSAKQLHCGAFSQGIYCKLYVGETAMVNGSAKSLFSKMTGDGEHGDKDATANGGESATHRVFRTRTVPAPADAETAALWDENFDVIVPDMCKDILSVRVKSKHRLFPAVLGVCAIPLWQLKIGRSVDKWVPLLKGTREVASLRIQIVLSPITNPDKLTERSKSDLQADIKTALAANQSAEDAINRLISSCTFTHSTDGGKKLVMLPTDPEELIREYKKGNNAEEPFHQNNEIESKKSKDKDEEQEPFQQQKIENKNNANTKDEHEKGSSR